MIRYDKKLTAELNRAVRNFNAKRNRLIKAGYDPTLIPRKESVAILKETYGTRKELRYKLNQMKQFNQRGAEKAVETATGNRLSVYQMNVLKQNRRRAKITLTKRIRRLEETTPTVFGKKQARTYGQMGSEELANLRAKRELLNKSISTIAKGKLGAFVQFVEKQVQLLDRKDYIFFNNIFDIIQKAGWQAGVSEDRINHVLNKLSELNYKQFAQLQETEKSFKAVVYYYDLALIQNANDDDPNVIYAKAQFVELFNQFEENIDKLVDEYKQK